MRRIEEAVLIGVFGIASLVQSSCQKQAETNSATVNGSQAQGILLCHKHEGKLHCIAEPEAKGVSSPSPDDHF
jgi:hypothetical protein